MIHTRVLLVIGLIVPLMSACVSAPDRGSVEVNKDGKHVAVIFSDRDRAVIHDYYHGYKKRKKVPPGLAKRDRLPPGLEKQLQRNGRLPPGLEGRALPYDLERQLSYLPRDYVRVRVGGDIVLMNKHSRVIVDIIKDI